MSDERFDVRTPNGDMRRVTKPIAVIVARRFESPIWDVKGRRVAVADLLKNLSDA